MGRTQMDSIDPSIHPPTHLATDLTHTSIHHVHHNINIHTPAVRRLEEVDGGVVDGPVRRGYLQVRQLHLFCVFWLFFLGGGFWCWVRSYARLCVVVFFRVGVGQVWCVGVSVYNYI